MAVKSKKRKFQKKKTLKVYRGGDPPKVHIPKTPNGSSGPHIKRRSPTDKLPRRNPTDKLPNLPTPEIYNRRNPLTPNILYNSFNTYRTRRSPTDKLPNIPTPEIYNRRNPLTPNILYNSFKKYGTIRSKIQHHGPQLPPPRKSANNQPENFNSWGPRKTVGAFNTSLHGKKNSNPIRYSASNLYENLNLIHQKKPPVYSPYMTMTPVHGAP